jgi:hypothetical protein
LIHHIIIIHDIHIISITLYDCFMIVMMGNKKKNALLKNLENIKCYQNVTF